MIFTFCISCCKKLNTSWQSRCPTLGSKISRELKNFIGFEGLSRAEPEASGN
jgi:hypothetical protein